MPKSFVDHYQKQWTDAHPDFVFKMWCEDNLSAEDFINKEIILDKSLNPGLRADALRLELLYKYGGIYIDIDMALVKPIHSFLQSFKTDFFISTSNTPGAFEVNNAIIGCIPQHPLIKHLIAKLRDSFKSKVDSNSK